MKTMRMIYGHIEAVRDGWNTPSNLVVRTRTYRLECVVSASTRISRGSQKLGLSEILDDEFVVATVRAHDGWLEAERIDIIVGICENPLGKSHRTR